MKLNFFKKYLILIVVMVPLALPAAPLPGGCFSAVSSISENNLNSPYQKLALLEDLVQIQFPGFFNDHNSLFPPPGPQQEKLLRKISRINFSRLSRQQILNLVESIYVDKLSVISQTGSLFNGGIKITKEQFIQSNLEKELLGRGLVEAAHDLGILKNPTFRESFIDIYRGNIAGLKDLVIMSIDVGIMAYHGVNKTTALIFLPSGNLVKSRRLSPELIDGILMDGINSHLPEISRQLGISTDVSLFYSLVQRSWNTTASAILAMMLLNSWAVQNGYSYHDLTDHFSAHYQTLQQNAETSVESFLDDTGTPYDRAEVKGQISKLSPTALRNASGEN